MSNVSTIEFAQVPPFIGRARALNNIGCLIGHSGLDQAIGQTISGTQKRNAILDTRSYPAWVSMLSRGHYVFKEDCKFAVSGTLVADIRDTVLTAATAPSGFGVGKTQLQAAIECRASFVIIMTGHNDRINGRTLAENIAVMTDIIRQLTAAGKLVCLVTEWPSGSATYTARRLAGTQLAYRNGWRRWLMEEAPKLARGMIVVADTFRALVNARSTTPGDVLDARTQDGVHPNSPGSYFEALEVIRALNSFGIPYISPDIHMPGEVYDAANNPNGNLLGALGTLADAGTTWTQSAQGGVSFSGTKPAAAGATSIMFANGAAQAGSLNVVGAIVELADGPWWELTITGSTAAGTNPNLAFAPVSLQLANLAVGDVLAQFGEWQVQQGAVGLCGFFPSIYRTEPGPLIDNMAIGYNAFTGGGSLDTVFANATAPIGGTWNGDLTTVVSGTETQSINTSRTLQLAPNVANVNIKARMRNIADRKVAA